MTSNIENARKVVGLLRQMEIKIIDLDEANISMGFDNLLQDAIDNVARLQRAAMAPALRLRSILERDIDAPTDTQVIGLRSAVVTLSQERQMVHQRLGELSQRCYDTKGFRAVLGKADGSEEGTYANLDAKLAQQCYALCEALIAEHGLLKQSA